MGTKMLQRHYGDETLLACLDGELSQFRARAVNAHLKVCWECRAKLVQLESQAGTVARLFLEQVPSDISRSARGLERFLRVQERLETQWSADPSSTASDSVEARRGLRVAVAIGVVCVVGLSIWRLTCRSSSRAADV